MRINMITGNNSSENELLEEENNCHFQKKDRYGKGRFNGLRSDEGESLVSNQMDIQDLLSELDKVGHLSSFYLFYKKKS